MDIAQMRMMLVLAESKSMTTTAKKLHVTQPSLTYQLKVIENELGFKVFNRTRTGTSLTAEGAFLHEALKGIVANYDETVRLARAMAKGTAAGTIRVGVDDSSRDTISFLLNVAQSALSFSLRSRASRVRSLTGSMAGVLCSEPKETMNPSSSR